MGEEIARQVIELVNKYQADPASVEVRKSAQAIITQDDTPGSSSAPSSLSSALRPTSSTNCVR
jgi:hypothetical protein